MGRTPNDRDTQSEARRAADAQAAGPETVGAEPRFCYLRQPEDRQFLIEEMVMRVGERFESFGAAVASFGNQLEALRESFNQMAQADMILAGEVRERTRAVAERQDALGASVTDKLNSLKDELAVLVVLELQKLRSGQATGSLSTAYRARPRRAEIEDQIQALERTARDADETLTELREAHPDPDYRGANTRQEIEQVRSARDIAQQRIIALKEEF